jgi:hypothetical protein
MPPSPHGCPHCCLESLPLLRVVTDWWKCGRGLVRAHSATMPNRYVLDASAVTQQGVNDIHLRRGSILSQQR